LDLLADESDQAGADGADDLELVAAGCAFEVRAVAVLTHREGHEAVADGAGALVVRDGERDAVRAESFADLFDGERFGGHGHRHAIFAAS
jgi:3-deoxy-D-manno-octulosonic acid (KDO) 8-phosphate synthase